jgi:hypothetical protein
MLDVQCWMFDVNFYLSPRMKLYVFAQILNLLSVIPGLTRNPVLSVCSGCRIESGMTKAELLEDHQNFITPIFF